MHTVSQTLGDSFSIPRDATLIRYQSSIFSTERRMAMMVISDMREGACPHPTMLFA